MMALIGLNCSCAGLQRRAGFAMMAAQPIDNERT
jgi:hypothetical protein